jgi:hypothetical protein
MILWYVYYYRTRGYWDEELYNNFLEDFEKWDIKYWEMVLILVIREIRDFLQKNGVYIVLGGLIARRLATIVKSQEELIWPEKEIQKQVKLGFNLSWNYLVAT